ncbi:hypothetical protein FHS55_002622 [Angulomicrobium tetraedrale]|uniref:Uncharacterized protein n=1 Tax=Ancylobacter tetraedralis TaxID=217068 RepID=A0A839ZB69_9HYPH|nr:hypothetical protein [Ancylobacter tetraedralis]MBB3772013.1 hypothetical protein [Ancylobacter tetraedralis]
MTSETDIELANGVTRPMLRSRAASIVEYGQSHASWKSDPTAGYDVDLTNDRAAAYGIKFKSVAEFLSATGGKVLSGTGASRVLELPWTDNSAYVVAEFTNPPEAWAAGSKVALSIGSSSTHYVQASRNTSGMWTVAGYTAGTLFFLPVGFGPIGGPIVRVAFSFGSTLRGAYNGADTQVSTNYPGTAPTVTKITIGGDRDGANYGSAFRRFTVYPTPTTDNAVVKAASLPAYDIRVDGDSGAGGGGVPEVGLARSLALLGWTPYTTAIGGSPLSSGTNNIKDRMLAAPAWAKALLAVWWDYDNNNYAANATDLASHQAIVDSLGHTRYLIIPSAKREGQIAGQQTAVTTLTASLLATFPAHVLPCMPYLLSLGNGSTDNTAVGNGNVPPSAMIGDGVHLTDAAMTGFAALVDSAMRGMAWGMAA